MNAHQIEVINEYATDKKEGYCYSCGTTLLHDATEKLKNEQQALNNKLLSSVQNMLVVSIPNPPGWNFKSLGVVTGQLVIGTGMLSEISQTVSDLMGKTSNDLKAKLQQGEKACMTQLRLQTVTLGGNAVVGVDIDYAELGGARGMIMVCMTGTAVYISNIQEVTYIHMHSLNEITNVQKRYKRVNQLMKYADSN
jgi:uncharacterized protein YbjQ (UPF0145 family)